ncbi:hypothetical protein VB780_12765 [Leptolyngbya sp. CCNP1308]|uniref:hypothetical protein n=1 Tax=Leptolyngbya sp. CCNP1308 TaxID=3110255 RepID=UPI002B21BA05|nr:hypothetical protein [Leptolyngbya sp. CCNP1308]MEA5449448.1 hypothetical protein [Leptolyngbya sp. CCNP1308]
MSFFVPTAQNPEEAEKVYRAVAEFVEAPINERRVRKLQWRHNGMNMECEVGEKLPAYFRTGDEVVVAIFDSSQCYKVCTYSRGVVRGDPILAGKGEGTYASFFEKKTP